MKGQRNLVTQEPGSNNCIADGRPNPDRTWTECFAQLVGTVLSLWDAAELDAAGEDGEVLPKFVNLTDASIKMVNHSPEERSQVHLAGGN